MNHEPNRSESAARLVFQEGEVDSHADFAQAVRLGLSSSPKQLPCRYLYDETGSQIFEEICALPEYYVTRAETEILTHHARAIVRLLSPRSYLVELGSGSSVKTRLLVAELLRLHGRLRYIPIDISPTILAESAQALLRDFPGLEVTAIAAEYGEALKQLRMSAQPKVIVWLGSNIGNFSRRDACQFLASLRQQAARWDRLLLGIDLRKSRRVLEAAYADSRGVTARFNLNLLERINRELGGHFDRSRFGHYVRYNEPLGRVELYLQSHGAQTVAIDELGMKVPFFAGELIHTENSHKYSVDEMEALARDAGWDIEAAWFDSRRRFRLNLLVPSVH